MTPTYYRERAVLRAQNGPTFAIRVRSHSFFGFFAAQKRGTTMTINDLWNDLLRNIKQINYIPLTEASGETWAVDISVLLHQFCKLDDVVLALNSEPPYAPVSLLNALKNWHNGLTSSGIMPFYVFDGYLSHPMKAAMHEARKRTVDKAKEELEEFYRKGRDGEPIGEDDRSRALSNLRTITQPTERVISAVVNWFKEAGISFMCAPFEADWQLAYLDRIGQVDGIVSVDGDVIMLGVRKVCFKVNIGQRKFQAYEKDSVTCDPKYNISQIPTRLWPYLSALLGCDYIKRVHNFGPAKTYQLLKNWNDGKISTLLSKLRSTVAHWRDTEVDDNYDDQFQKTINLLKHNPVLNENSNLVPSNNLPADGSFGPWGEGIGFGVSHPSKLLPVGPEQYGAASRFDGVSFMKQNGAGIRVLCRASSKHSCMLKRERSSRPKVNVASSRSVPLAAPLTPSHGIILAL